MALLFALSVLLCSLWVARRTVESLARYSDRMFLTPRCFSGESREAGGRDREWVARPRDTVRGTRPA